METFKKFMRRGDVLIVCGLATIAGLAALGFQHDFKRGDWASWVQAVGSIAALGVAIFIMKGQSRAAIELVVNSDRNTALRKALAVHVLVENCHKSVFATMKQLEDSLNNREHASIILGKAIPWNEMLTEARTGLITVPMHELGSAELVHAAIGTLENMLFLIKTLEDWRDDGYKNFDTAVARKVVTHHRSIADSLFGEFRSGCENLAKI